MANSMWVTLQIFLKSCSMYFPLLLTGCEQHWRFLWKVVSSYLSLWPTGSKWHYTFCQRQSHHIFSYETEGEDSAHFVKASLITSFPMTNSKWVTLHILWKTVHHILSWSTASEWHCIFCERQSHHMFSSDQQSVSDITHSVKGSLITTFPMINSLWVILPILWMAVSSHLFPWPIVCEWHYTFCERQSITSFPLINREWVTLHILWKAVSSHLFLWPTGCE